MTWWKVLDPFAQTELPFKRIVLDENIPLLFIIGCSVPRTLGCWSPFSLVTSFFFLPVYFLLLLFISLFMSPLSFFLWLNFWKCPFLHMAIVLVFWEETKVALLPPVYNHKFPSSPDLWHLPDLEPWLKASSWPTDTWKAGICGTGSCRMTLIFASIWRYFDCAWVRCALLVS